jgi:hypothetical protein
LAKAELDDAQSDIRIEKLSNTLPPELTPDRKQKQSKQGRGKQGFKDR